MLFRVVIDFTLFDRALFYRPRMFLFGIHMHIRSYSIPQKIAHEKFPFIKLL